MKKMMILALMFLAPLAQADIRLMLTNKYHPAAFKIDKDSARINFDNLLMTYDNSRKASFDELKGVYAGRCVSIFDPKTIAGVLFVTEIEKEKKVMVLVNESGPEEYFYNNYSSYEIVRDTQSFGRDVGAVISEKPLVGTDAIVSGETLWMIGKSQADLVSKAVYQGESGSRYLYGHKPVYINKGEAYGACLYTKKLQ